MMRELLASRFAANSYRATWSRRMPPTVGATWRSPSFIVMVFPLARKVKLPSSTALRGRARNLFRWSLPLRVRDRRDVLRRVVEQRADLHAADRRDAGLHCI